MVSVTLTIGAYIHQGTSTDNSVPTLTPGATDATTTTPTETETTQLLVSKMIRFEIRKLISSLGLLDIQYIC